MSHFGKPHGHSPLKRLPVEILVQKAPLCIGMDILRLSLVPGMVANSINFRLQSKCWAKIKVNTLFGTCVVSFSWKYKVRRKLFSHELTFRIKIEQTIFLLNYQIKSEPKVFRLNQEYSMFKTSFIFWIARTKKIKCSKRYFLIES